MTPQVIAERDTVILTPTTIVGTWLPAAALKPAELPPQVMAAVPVSGLWREHVGLRGALQLSS